MKFNFFTAIIITLLTITSCIKHEIVPAPTSTVSLTSKFSGLVNGVPVDLNEGISGYTCLPTQDKNLLSSPLLSSAIFYAEMFSVSEKKAFRIGLGKAFWDANTSSEPSLEIFNNFFIKPSSILPSYKDDCSQGFNVRYTDDNGTIYTSRDTSTQFQNVKFTNIAQESDATGDYCKFTCTFNCYVYYLSGPNPPIGLDSVKIQNGQLKGWFKK
jgi:hypothetical protein